MKITSLHQATSLERVNPESGFGDVGEGGIVQGQGGIPMVGTLGDGQVWVYDAATGTLVPGDVGSSAPSFDITPALSNAMAPWVKPTGSGVITNDAQGRLTIDTGSGYKSFPGMTFLEGRLHLVYRQGTDHAVSADGVIKYRHSDDLGRTRSTAVTIASGVSDDMRDPSIVALSSGRLLVGFDQVSGGYEIKITYSDNGGQSWSSTYVVPATGLAYEVAGTSQMVELPDGTILLPAFGKNLVGDKYKCLLFRSTDGGLTFGSQTDVTDGSADRVELQVRLLASGNLVCLYHDITTANVYRKVSTDGGLTFGGETTVNSELGAGRTDFVEFFPGALFLMGRKSQASSQNYWAVSWDEGVTWTASQVVDGATDVNMYAAPVLLAAGYLAVAYSIENSSTDADLYLRYYHDGYGIDPLGNLFALTVPGSAISAASIRDVGGHWEVLMDPATSSPPVPITTAAGDDWVYGWLAD